MSQSERDGSQDPPTHSVHHHLRVEIDAYDDAIRRFIPGYEEMIEVAARKVAEVRPGTVMDLGAGTGALSAAILAYPEVGEVELVDVDEAMLRRARGRLAGYGNRVRVALRSYHDDFPPCDAIAASLALHHIPSIHAKTELYRRVAEGLAPGGVFVNADVTVPEREPARRRVLRSWIEHMVASGIDETRAWGHLDEWAEEDTYFPLEVELAALRKAGLDAECVWQEGPSTVLACRPAN